MFLFLLLEQKIQLSFCRKKDKKGKKKKLVEVSKIIEEEKSPNVEVKRTKAELAFQKMQEKMVSIIAIRYIIAIKHMSIMTSVNS